MVMANFSSSIPDPAHDGAKWLRVYWSLLTALLTIAMLVAGGVTTMEYATLIFALPVTLIAYLVMASFSKALRMERAEREGQVLRRRSAAATGGRAPERSWRQRLAGMRSFPSLGDVERYLERTIRPALADVAREFRGQGYHVELGSTLGAQAHVQEPTLVVQVGEGLRDFHYQVAVVEAQVPMFGARLSREPELYYRLEVSAQTGSEGYDLFGLTKQQIIDDVLDRYEAHLAFLVHSSETAALTVITPKMPPVTGQHPTVPTTADDVQDLDEDPPRE